MPKAPTYITAPAVITKAEIAEVARLKGCSNVFHFELNGVTYDPKKLRFATFAGARQDDGLYHGELRFEAGDWKDSRPADLNQVPGLPSREPSHHLQDVSGE